MNKKIIFFSGAGMSAESGISTFRDSGGLWEKYKIEDIATPDAWRRNTDLVTDFYNQRRKQIIETEPNEAHRIIAELEKNHDVVVITQNIDDLHERAGSTHVLLLGQVTEKKEKPTLRKTRLGSKLTSTQETKMSEHPTIISVLNRSW